MTDQTKPETKSVRHACPPPTTFDVAGSAAARKRPHAGNYSPEIARAICQRLMEGKTLTEIARDRRFPAPERVARWLGDPKLTEFREMYYHARRVAAEMLVDRMFDEMNDTSSDFKPNYDKKGEFTGYVPDNEAIQRSKLKVDTYKWFAAKMLPRLYGQDTVVGVEAKGQLAELLAKAANQSNGLPKPVND